MFTAARVRLCVALALAVLAALLPAPTTSASAAPAVRTDPVGGDVVGGPPVGDGSQPSFVSLRTEAGDHFCGGTMLSPTDVLTAATCVATRDPSEVFAWIGGSSLVGDEAEAEIRRIVEVEVMPGFDPDWCPSQIPRHDVAVLTLDEPSTAAWTRVDDSAASLPDDLPVRAVGHGAGDGSEPPADELHEVVLGVRPADDVERLVGTDCFDSSTMLAAGPRPPEVRAGICSGDEGGPLTVVRTEEVNAPVVGVASWHLEPCGEYPSVFAAVHADELRTFVESTVERPPNDDFALATPIAGRAGTIRGTTTAATAQAAEPGDGSPEATVWYRWIAPSSDPVTFDVNTLGSSNPDSWNSTIGVYSGSGLSTLSLVAYNDDWGASRESRVTFTPSEDAVYHVRIDAFSLRGVSSGTSPLNWGDFDLGWSQDRPANDDVASATPLVGPSGQISQRVGSATHEPGEPDVHVDAADGSVWFRWAPTGSGRATISLAHSSFDTTVTVYDGTGLDDMVRLGSNDDHGLASQSKLDLSVTDGQRVLIAVDAKNPGPPTPDDLELQWSLEPPLEDDIDDAKVVPGYFVEGRIAGATAEPGEPAPQGAPVRESVWVRWTAPVTDTFEIVVGNRWGPAWDPQVGVWSSGSFGTQELLAAGDDFGIPNRTYAYLSAVAGREYWLQIGVRRGQGADYGVSFYAASSRRCDASNVTIIGSGVIYGTPGNDTIWGSPGDDVIYGLGGNDVICSQDGDDVLYGGEGRDRFLGMAGDDVIHPGPGDDNVNGGPGNDTVSYADSPAGVVVNLPANAAHDDGFDRISSVDDIVGSAHADHLVGNGQSNLIRGGAGPDLLEGGSGDDALYGDGGPDELRGGPGNDMLAGGPAADLLRGDEGDDVLAGGSDVDTASYRNATVGVTVDLAAGTASGQGDDLFVGDVEDILGSQLDDTLSGNAGPNKIQGRGGADTIDGRAGDDDLRGNGKDDVIVGGAGDDRLHGGSGADSLEGGEGRDELIGSSGAPDLCDGGLDVDTHGGGCESLTGIP